VKLIQLVYVSSATAPMSKTDLLALLNRTRVKNEQAEITGMLLFKDGSFMQALEGRKSVVIPLYENKIKRDPRHTGIITLFQAEIAEREFPNWSMAFPDLNDASLAAYPGYSEFLNVSFKDKSFTSDKSKARRLISIFRQNMR